MLNKFPRLVLQRGADLKNIFNFTIRSTTGKLGRFLTTSWQEKGFAKKKSGIKAAKKKLLG
jgi:hypothetical protein